MYEFLKCNVVSIIYIYCKKKYNEIAHRESISNEDFVTKCSVIYIYCVAIHCLVIVPQLFTIRRWKST